MSDWEVTSSRDIQRLEEERNQLRDQNAELLGQLDAMEFSYNVLNGKYNRLREALTPSEATKWAYMSEFVFRFGDRTVNVPWTTIKEIMYAIQDRADSIGAK